MRNGLIELRKKAKMSRFQLAIKLNVTPQSIYNWEKGISDPTAKSIYDMAKLFRISTDDIFLALSTTKVVK